jgi:calcium-dependent protein kinase
MINKSHFIGEHIANINQTYNFIKELGQGSYGHVIRIQNIVSGQVFACKKMNKRKITNKQRFKTEIDLLRATDHPNIIKLYDIFEDSVFIYLIMEECAGGEFFDRLARRAKKSNMYTEKEAAKIFKQLLQAVNYLHSHGVCHRDLKPENILFSTVAEDSPIKLIDFGLSKVFDGDNNTMKGAVGTTFYMAPEVIKGKYNEKCDVWSCGVILYIMLCGKPPFYSQDEDELKNIICSMKYDFNYPEFKKISQDAKDLIKSILVNADSRPSISDVLQNKWVEQNAPNALNDGLSIDWNHAKKYSKLNLLQKSVINFTAFHLNEEETAKFVEMFKSLDENNDGVLSIEEIRNGIEKQKVAFGGKINVDDVIDMFNEMDVDKNGLVNYTEFVSSMMDYEKVVKKEHLLECFKSYDTDGSGKISFEEFCDMIKPQNDKEKKELQELYRKFDANGDGEIDFEEFVEGFNKM